MILDDTPIQQKTVKDGEFSLWCRKGKAFVKVYLPCIVRNLKKDKRNVDVAPPEKCMRTPMINTVCYVGLVTYVSC